MMKSREKFASQADPQLLAAVRNIAAKEGKQFQALIHEALQDLVDKKSNATPRPKVLAAFDASLREFDALYHELAK